jgi:WD repeat-containing protein 35
MQQRIQIMEKRTPKRRVKTTSDSENSPTASTEAKGLKSIKKIIERQGYQAAIAIAESSPDCPPSVWKIIAESALKGLDFEKAENAFVKYQFYPGIYFCQRISKLDSDAIKRSQVHAFFGEFDNAENVLLDVERRDLAIGLRKTLGHYPKVLELMQNTGEETVDKAEMKKIMSFVGDYYSERMDHLAASRHYNESGDTEKLFNSYLAVEDFDAIKELIDKVAPENKDILMSFASVFESVGMCQEAVKAFVKAGNVREAVRCCVSLNEWKTALSLAQENGILETDSLLTQYSSHLIQQDKLLDVIELYRKANRIHDASNMIIKIIQDIRSSVPQAEDEDQVSPLILKQLYCLIGLLHTDLKQPKAGQRRNTLTSLLREDEDLVSASLDFRVQDNPWKGAEAYHFYLLAHRLFYGKSDKLSIDNAMKASLRLMDYEDYLDPEDIYSLIALTACANKNFAIASKAFIKLESLENINEDRRLQYQDLATEIFMKNVPKESRNIPKVECSFCAALIQDYLTTCSSCNTSFSSCILTGRPIRDISTAWSCKRCNHFALKEEIKAIQVCSLCHFPTTSN